MKSVKHRTKRGFIVIAILVVTFVVFFFGLGFYLSPQSHLAKSDAIVAISGGETGARVDEAVKLFREGYAPQLIFSGAALDKSGPSNAAAMERQAAIEGVPPNKITIEERAADTAQNAVNVRNIISAADYHQIILVTSPYHQRRAYITFSRAFGPGVKILNHSAIDQTWRRSKWWATPQSFALTLTELPKTLFILVGGNPS